MNKRLMGQIQKHAKIFSAKVKDSKTVYQQDLCAIDPNACVLSQADNRKTVQRQKHDL